MVDLEMKLNRIKHEIYEKNDQTIDRNVSPCTRSDVVWWGNVGQLCPIDNTVNGQMGWHLENTQIRYYQW